MLNLFEIRDWKNFFNNILHSPFYWLLNEILDKIFKFHWNVEKKFILI